MVYVINIEKPEAHVEELQFSDPAEIISDKSQSETLPLKETLRSDDDKADGVDVVDADVAPTTKTELLRINSMNYAGNKNLAEGLMDIALLSANANQLRFLLTYNDKARTYYISLGLVGLSLVLQIVVGMTLIFKRHLSRNDPRYFYVKECLVCGVFVITVVNILLAAFTTTESGAEKA